MEYKIAEQDLGDIYMRCTHHDVMVDAIGEVFNMQPHLVTFLIPSPKQAVELKRLEMEVVMLRSTHFFTDRFGIADETLLLHFFKNRIEDLIEMFASTSLGANIKHRVPALIKRGDCFDTKPEGAFMAGSRAHTEIYGQAVVKAYRERASGVVPYQATELGVEDTSRLVELGRSHFPDSIVLHTAEPVADMGKALMQMRVSRERVPQGGYKMALEMPCPIYGYNKNMSIYTCD